MMSWFDLILTSMQVEQPRLHSPTFHMEVVNGDFHIFDENRLLGIFRRTSLDILMFSPHDIDHAANPPPTGPVIDLHTVQNTFLNFGSAGWPGTWRLGDLRWKWLRSQGEELVAQIALDSLDGDICRWCVSLSYDVQWGRYRWRIAIDARKVTPEGFECFNLMTAGALACQSAHRRWTHSIWENPDGKLRRIVHSNALFMATDYGNLERDSGPWRTYHLPFPHAWIGYAAHLTFNPVLLIHRTNVPLMGAICSQLFDEHMIWSRAGQDQLDDDGRFHFQMELEFINLPAALAASLLSQASDPVRPRYWRQQRWALPFQLGRINSFEETIDPWEPHECPILIVSTEPDGDIAWSDEYARSGTRSLRLRQRAAGELRLHPMGAVCRVEPHTRYSFRAWVKTKQVSGVSLELQSYAYTYDNVHLSARSPILRGDVDWTLLQVELDSEEMAYVMPYFVLHGPGIAWFDDAGLRPVDRLEDIS
jgi:hypothetical protein